MLMTTLYLSIYLSIYLPHLSVSISISFSRTTPGAQIAVPDDGGRASAGAAYWQSMKEARIVAHANPGNWEGDFRLWESLCSKALVFVDYLYIPHAHPLIDGEDVVFYDPLDKQAFIDKVQYYLSHEHEARRIAMNGFYKALRHHRYVNRVDYILNTVNLLMDPSYQVRSSDGCTEMGGASVCPYHSVTEHQANTLTSHIHTHTHKTELGHEPQGDHDALAQAFLCAADRVGAAVQ